MDAGHADCAYVRSNPPTAHSHGPEGTELAAWDQINAVLLSVADFLKRSEVAAKNVAAAAGSCPSSLFISHFLSNTNTFGGTRRAHKYTHGLHTGGGTPPQVTQSQTCNYTLTLITG